MKYVTVFLGGPLDGATAPRGGVRSGHAWAPDGAVGRRFEVVNRRCPVNVAGAWTYRRHVYEVVGRRPGPGGEVPVLAEHIRAVD